MDFEEKKKQEREIVRTESDKIREEINTEKMRRKFRDEVLKDIQTEIEQQQLRQIKEDADKGIVRRLVLIVDDDPVALRTFMNILKDEYRVVVAKSGVAGIECMDREKPDLVLLDYAMPILDGVKTLELIRSQDNIKDVPVFFLTAVKDTDMVLKAIALNPAGYILKSSAPEELKSRIREFFETNGL